MSAEPINDDQLLAIARAIEPHLPLGYHVGVVLARPSAAPADEIYTIIFGTVVSNGPSLFNAASELMQAGSTRVWHPDEDRA
jgi:hypothetical protein